MNLSTSYQNTDVNSNSNKPIRLCPFAWQALITVKLGMFESLRACKIAMSVIWLIKIWIGGSVWRCVQHTDDHCAVCVAVALIEDMFL